MPAEPCKPSLPNLESYGKAFRQRQLRPEADARIRELLAAPMSNASAPRVHRFGYWAVAASVVTALALWVSIQAWHAADATRCAVETTQGVTSYRGACRLEFAALSVDTDPGATLRQTSEQVELAEGSARFAVRKVTPGNPPVKIHVPGARVEVLGTEFEILLEDTKGEIMLHEGRVRFVSDDHFAVVMQPGERLSWRWDRAAQPFAAPEERPAAAASGFPSVHDQAKLAPGDTEERRVTEVETPSSGELQLVPQPELPSIASGRRKASAALRPRGREGATGGAAPAQSPIARILQLRTQGKYGQALRTLDSVVAQGVDVRAREVLSYERGLLLEKLNPSSACAQFARHKRIFGASRYAGPLARRLQRCEQQSPPGSGATP